MAAKQTVLGQGTHVVGEVRGDDALVVYGRVEGRIDITDELTIEPGAIVQADVQARSVVVSGVLVGAITASESVRLTPKARVVGSIVAPKVGIEAGAGYRGRIEMGEVDVQRSQSAAASADRGRTATVAAKAPPRLASPAKAASVSAPAAPARPAAAPVAPPRAVSAPPRPTTVAAQAPAWARKKATKRR
ncbi:MAG: polymer-forming cytoskeletal protein [Deltaproteobacteria bacterium]|nr:polymer-forming cytoskeletal protein [Deltaproteobacteria bacterium]